MKNKFLIILVLAGILVSSLLVNTFSGFTEAFSFGTDIAPDIGRI